MNNLFNVDGNIWIKKDNRSFIGRGRIELLENIQIYGSISKASKAMKMSYKAAWDSIDIMNKLSNKPLVTKIKGGKGGGGTVITSHAKEIIKAYSEISALYKNYFNTLSNSFNEQVIESNYEEPTFTRLTGIIKNLENINNSFEVTIELPSKQLLTSIESKRFIIEKDLAVDNEINFLIETNNIVLTKEILNNSARNTLKGKIDTIVEEGINISIAIKTKDDILHAKITQASYKKLEFKVGDKVYASFKAYNITII